MTARHAVVCDGSAMQRVPGSLRYLVKICREAGVPLYVINDPRTWGCQTHPTLADALSDLKKTVSDNIIRNALDLREGTAFERGRLVGRLEKEMAWQAHDAARKTREGLTDARRRLMNSKVADWSELTEEDLLRKLVGRKVIALQRDGKPGRSPKCSDGLVGLCRRCFETDSEKFPTADPSK
ncbi:hypothetical protein ACHAW5_008467 [Stephanodiscus triporus]|uniref:Uncharacterized protein n=1 Tax=Stephanodiscus triporus TaxID=2934178 RepID=A0ABD3MLK8_9STRA